MRWVICLLFIFFSNASSSILTVETPNYNLTWDYEFPHVMFTSNLLTQAGAPTNVLLIYNVSHLEEHHYNATQQKIDNFGTPFQSAPLDQKFSYEIFNRSNAIGISYFTTLENNATFRMNFTVSLDEDTTIDVPREDQTCNISRHSITYPEQANCTCNPTKVVRRHALKFSIGVTDWPFLPLEEGYFLKKLAIWCNVVAPLDFEYYFSGHNNYQRKFETCDVAELTFKFNYDIDFIFSTVTYCYVDDNTIRSAFLEDNKSMLTVNGSTKLVNIPFAFMLPEFEYKADFDPDFSMVFPKETSGDDSSDNKDWEVPVIVSVIGVAVIFFVIGTILLVVVYYKRKQTAKLLRSATNSVAH